MAAMNGESLTGWAIAPELRGLPLDISVQTDWAGQRLDLLATASTGAILGVVLKQWEAPTQAMIDKAHREAELLAEVGGVDRAFIIIPTLTDDQQTEVVRNTHGLRPSVADWLAAEPDFGLRGPAAKLRGEPNKRLKRIFVAMPFAAHFEYLGIIPAAQQAAASCVRIDQQYLSGQIINSIHAEITRADLVIADVTGGNPNVTYELGYAHGLKKPAVHLSATPPEQLPFDLRQWSAVFYTPGQVHRLKSQLQAVLIQLFADQPAPPA